MTRFAKFVVSAAAIATLPVIGHAETAMDADGDGLLTIAEVQAVMPEVSADQFNAMDANADGALDEAEIKTAQEAGLMKK